MKKILLSLLLLATSGTLAFGQTNGDGAKLRFIDKITANLYATRGFNQHDTKNMSLGVDLGYKVMPWLSVLFNSEYKCGLYNPNDEHHYFESSNIGGGLGFTVLGPKYYDKKSDVVDIVAKMTASVGNHNWKNTAYDLGVKWRYASKKACAVPTFGLGFTHINSHTAGIRDYNFVYVTIGIGF